MFCATREWGQEENDDDAANQQSAENAADQHRPVPSSSPSSSSHHWVAPSSGTTLLPPVFPPVPPPPPAQSSQAALLSALVNSGCGGTITVAPDGTTSVTIPNPDDRPAVTRWQQSGGKGTGQWITNKRERAAAHHRRLQEMNARGESPRPPNNNFLMCRVCARGQAGMNCDHQCCGPCCHANHNNDCSQHSLA